MNAHARDAPLLDANIPVTFCGTSRLERGHQRVVGAL